MTVIVCDWTSSTCTFSSKTIELRVSGVYWRTVSTALLAVARSSNCATMLRVPWERRRREPSGEGGGDGGGEGGGDGGGDWGGGDGGDRGDGGGGDGTGEGGGDGGGEGGGEGGGRGGEASNVVCDLTDAQCASATSHASGRPLLVKDAVRFVPLGPDAGRPRRRSAASFAVLPEHIFSGFRTPTRTLLSLWPPPPANNDTFKLIIVS